jgi:hypothetical protein
VLFGLQIKWLRTKGGKYNLFWNESFLAPVPP